MSNNSFEDEIQKQQYETIFKVVKKDGVFKWPKSEYIIKASVGKNVYLLLQDEDKSTILRLTEINKDKYKFVSGDGSKVVTLSINDEKWEESEGVSSGIKNIIPGTDNVKIEKEADNVTISVDNQEVKASHISRVGASGNLNGENLSFRITPWKGDTLVLQQLSNEEWVDIATLIPSTGVVQSNEAPREIIGFNNDYKIQVFETGNVEEDSNKLVIASAVFEFVKDNLTTAGTDLKLNDKEISVDTEGKAEGEKSFVLGDDLSNAQGDYSFAGGKNRYGEGQNATGLVSFAFGSDVHANGNWSKSTGYKNRSTSKELLDDHGTFDGNTNGYLTKDIKVVWYEVKDDAEAINGSYQIGEGAVTSGAKNVVIGARSEASGNTNLVTGRDSKASNSNNEVYGNYAHAEGRGNQCWGNAQSVFGKYNDPMRSDGVGDNSPYLEIVGNGSSNTKRSNARTLDKNGNERIAGEVYPNGGSKSYTDLINEAAGAVTIGTIEL